MKLRHARISLSEANRFVAELHRHHPPVIGHLFSIGAVLGEQLVGVAIVGRPVARMRDDGVTAEVTRLCTDGTRNACSFLYGRCAKAAFALGFERIGTYTLPDEGGASLRAAGWTLIGRRGGGEWSVPWPPNDPPIHRPHPIECEMLTITKDQFNAIAMRVAGHKTCHGVGDTEESCTVAHIQIALTGEVIDRRPDCMSPVIHAWIIPMQDAMPLERLNADRWQRLIPFAAGTGEQYEKERLDIILDWMWGAVLPQLQPLANANGFGNEWRVMTEDRTIAAAQTAAGAARAAEAARAQVQAVLAWTAETAARAAAEAMAQAALAWMAKATELSVTAALAAKVAAAEAAEAASFFDAIDPEGLLERLIAVSAGEELKTWGVK